MQIRLSQNLGAAIPTLVSEIHRTAKIACSFDEDIDVKNLYLEARCSRYYDAVGGQAWPETWTYFRRTGKRVEHRSGRITMSIGIHTDVLERVGTIAHELRHIGQFRRGALLYNEFGAEYMTGRRCEADAREFEELVKDRYE